MKKISIKRPKLWIAAVAAAAVVGLLVTTLFSGRVYITTEQLAAGVPALPVPEKAEGDVPEADGWVTVAQADGRRLEWDAQQVLFRVVSDTTGVVWESGYDFEHLDEYSKRNRRLLTTLLQINYLDASGAEASLNNTVSGVYTEASLLKNGMALQFTFEEAAISVTLQLTLDKWGLSLRIPEEELREEGECRLLSIDILPAFGSMLTGDDGFILYPDGCGTIMDCNSSGKTAGVYTKAVYADRYKDLEEVADAFARGETGVPLPYFGSALNGRRGCIAYVENGAENARVSLSIGSDTLPLNRLYTTAVYRFSRELTNSQGTTAIAFSTEREVLDYRVHYLLLEENAATYSDMAVTLRGFLQEAGILPSQPRSDTTVPITVEWLISVRQNELFHSGNLVMTSFQQVDESLKELEAAGVKSTRSLLLGWQKEGCGVYPLSTSALGAAGGRSGLASLLKTGGGDRMFFLETDYVQADSDGSFSKRQDAVTDFMHTVVTDASESRFLLNPLRQYDRFTRRDLSAYASLGAAGLAFNSLGRYLPADYASGRAASGADTRRAYAALLQKTQEQGMQAAVQTGTDYLLAGSNYVYDAYDLSSGLHMFTREIPFYQMLLHGLIAYSGVTPGNMSADFTQIKLHWVEYGCDPYFLLSEQSSGMLENAVISDVFNSRFDDWKDQIVQVYEEFNRRLSPLNGQKIQRHEYLSEDVACVTYENGSIVLVNYGLQETETPYGTVPAKDYMVIQGEGNGNEE